MEDSERVQDLKAEIAHLQAEVERYRTAAEDALQQLDWCIGYFTGCNKRGVSRSLSTNRAYIRRHLMHRGELSTPTETTPAQ